MPPPANQAVLVEVAVDSVVGAQAAAAAGAGRVELCSSLIEGGLTPSLGLMEAVRATVDIPVFCMVRPRSGDFLYDDNEIDVMQRDIELLGGSGADGFVTGVLDKAGNLDQARLEKLRKLCGLRPMTCHRAFDLCADPLAALTELQQLGIERVLTSGLAASAMAGADAIAQFVAIASNGITIVAGAGVRADNAALLIARTGCREIHLSATAWRDSAMKFRREGVPMGTATPTSEFVQRATDAEMIAGVVEAVR
jgi:copper homeostasis protein